LHVRVCPDCGEEFRPDIVRCSDCGALLVDRHVPEGSGSALPAGDDAQSDDPAPDADEPYVTVFSSTESEALREAAASLVAAGVAFRASAKGYSYQLLVHADDHAPAAQALAGRDGAIELAPGPAIGAGEESACPACGSRLAAGAIECPECGLVVGGEGTDPNLGGPRDEE
jgi:predicted RNA-binding Zn-ribbon protein involved in translation (DUF1610 family)